MQLKSYKLLSIILMLIVVILITAGCGKSGTRLGNQAPEIKITSFEGWDDSYVTNGYATNLVYSFRQRVYWHAWDKDGNIAGYAYRVLDENNNPIATPGNEYISSATDNLIPQNLLDLDPKGGWVIHYIPGEDETKPLNEATTRRTIWTSQKYAEINFPAADANGAPMQRVSKFEVVAIDNRGAITPVIAWRNFKTTSPRPTCNLSTSKGKPVDNLGNPLEVGAGLKLSFAMDDTDPFIPVIPYRYEFQVMKTNLAGAVITPPESLVWVDTKTQAVPVGEIPIISEFLLNLKSNPPLKYDYDANGVATTMTRVVGRATDMAGVVSLTDTTFITFKVKKGFGPKSLIYGKKTYAMGANHYEDWGDDTTPEVIPTKVWQGKQIWATPLFKDLEGKNTAVFSNDFKLWIRWGWFGEYGNVTSTGNTTFEEDNPYGKKVDVVLDRTTGVNYFSEITYFHLRYDNDYYKFPPYEHLKIQDDNGDWWLRIPVSSVIGQSILLTGLPIPPSDTPGEHVFQMACEDLQGVVDPQPAELRFYLHAYKPPNQRNGVLIIDDDLHHNSYSPDNVVQSFYESILADYTGDKRFVKQSPEGLSTNDTYADIRKRQIAFSDLQKYKLVLYHNDNPSIKGRFVDCVDALTLYMLNGGNLAVSHTSQIKSVLEELSPTGRRKTLKNLMGFNDVAGEISILGSSATNNPFFYKATANSPGFNDVALNVTTSFLQTVNTRKGLGSIAYFPSILAETIYKLGCKAVGTDAYSPTTSTQFNQYNNKPVGMRFINPTTNSRAYTFGFPFSYMVAADTKAMINRIITECGM